MRKKPKRGDIVMLEVTFKRKYVFREGEINGWTVVDVIRDWFMNPMCPMDSHHATRDHYAVGNTTEFVKAKRIPV